MLVESALLMPLILLLVFGVIEFSLAFRSSATLADASRAAGRTAARIGAAEEVQFRSEIATAAAAAVTTLPKEATPRSMIIYEAKADGLPSGITSWAGWPTGLGTCVGAGTCIVMIWNQTLETFTPFFGSWPKGNRAICGDDPDRVGVAIFSAYEPLTGLFDGILSREATGGNWNPMVDYAVFAFAPEPGDASC